MSIAELLQLFFMEILNYFIILPTLIAFCFLLFCSSTHGKLTARIVLWVRKVENELNLEFKFQMTITLSDYFFFHQTIVFSRCLFFAFLLHDRVYVNINIFFCFFSSHFCTYKFYPLILATNYYVMKFY